MPSCGPSRTQVQKHADARGGGARRRVPTLGGRPPSGRALQAAKPPSCPRGPRLSAHFPPPCSRCLINVCWLKGCRRHPSQGRGGPHSTAGHQRGAWWWDPSFPGRLPCAGDRHKGTQGSKAERGGGGGSGENALGGRKPLRKADLGVSDTTATSNSSSVREKVTAEGWCRAASHAGLHQPRSQPRRPCRQGKGGEG